MQKTSHNIIIYDAETLNAVAAAITDFEGTEGTFQSIDADDTYVYFPLSDVGGRGRNKIICFDWCAEKLAALLNGDSTEDVWYCGGSSTGGRSATINVAGADEIESLYHIESGNGKSRFYLVNYDNDPTYKTYKVKVKWKKVKKKKKVKVKWKKVKKKVKTKKGKIKIKKVWKYKTKIKKKKVWKYKYVDRKKFSHYNRDSFVMDMGVF